MTMTTRREATAALGTLSPVLRLLLEAEVLPGRLPILAACRRLVGAYRAHVRAGWQMPAHALLPGLIRETFAMDLRLEQARVEWALSLHLPIPPKRLVRTEWRNRVLAMQSLGTVQRARLATELRGTAAMETDGAAWMRIFLDLLEVETTTDLGMVTSYLKMPEAAQEAFAQQFTDRFSAAMSASAHDTVATLGIGASWTQKSDTAEAFMREYAGFYGDRMSKLVPLEQQVGLREAVIAGLDAGDSAIEMGARMQGVWENLDQFQAERIARTEAVRARTEGERTVYGAMGVRQVMWIVAANPCEDCAPRAGVVFPVDMDDPPPLHPQCLCDLVASDADLDQLHAIAMAGIAGGEEPLPPGPAPKYAQSPSLGQVPHVPPAAPEPPMAIVPEPPLPPPPPPPEIPPGLFVHPLDVPTFVQSSVWKESQFIYTGSATTAEVMVAEGLDVGMAHSPLGYGVEQVTTQSAPPGWAEGSVTVATDVRNVLEITGTKAGNETTGQALRRIVGEALDVPAYSENSAVADALVAKGFDALSVTMDGVEHRFVVDPKAIRVVKPGVPVSAKNAEALAKEVAAQAKADAIWKAEAEKVAAQKAAENAAAKATIAKAKAEQAVAAAKQAADDVLKAEMQALADKAAQDLAAGERPYGAPAEKPKRATKKALPGAARIEKMTDAMVKAKEAASSETLGPWGLHEEGAAKDKIVRDISKRLVDNKDFQAMIRAVGHEIPTGPGTYIQTAAMNPALQKEAWTQAKVDGLIKQWSMTSADNHPLPIALQLAAKEEFGLKSPSLYYTEGLIADAKERFGEQMAGMRAFLRAMYDNTQEEFQKKGIKTLTLHRGAAYDKAMPGLRWSGAEKTVTVQQANLILQPMNSFSTTVDKALAFAAEHGDGEYAAIQSAEVPVERIIGGARTGYGCLNEYEYVVLGGDHGDRWGVVTWTQHHGPAALQYNDMTQARALIAEASKSGKAVDLKKVQRANPSRTGPSNITTWEKVTHAG